LLSKLEEAELEASGRLESIAEQAKKEHLTAVRTIESKNEMIETDYI